MVSCVFNKLSGIDTVSNSSFSLFDKLSGIDTVSNLSFSISDKLSGIDTVSIFFSLIFIGLSKRLI